MAVAYQIAPISPMAHHTVMAEGVGKMRVSARLAEAANPPSPYVPVTKPPGGLTPKQQEANGDRERAREIIAQNGEKAFYEHFPPPPTSAEMNGLRDLATKAGDDNYDAHPVKTVPFASQVAQAYRQSQSQDGLYVQQVKLTRVYA